MTSVGGRQRIEWVDAGRGLAIILVALYHSARWAAAAGIDTSVWQTLNDILATLRMPLFFMLAGLFAQKWQTATWASLWRNKLSLFVWVFLLWSLIDSFSIMLGMQMQGQQGNYLRQVVDSVWSPVQPRFELWFIWALAIFFVIAKATRRVPPWAQLVVAGIASFIALSGIDFGNVGWNGLLRYYFFFLLGIHLRRRIIDFAVARRPIVSAAIAIGWAAFAISGSLLRLNEIPGFYFITAIGGVAAGIVVSRLLAPSDGMRYVGARTLPVYLTHTSVVLIVCWLLWLIEAHVTGWVLEVFATPVIAAIAVGVSLLLARTVAATWARYLYEQPAFLTGSKRKRVPAEE